MSDQEYYEAYEDFKIPADHVGQTKLGSVIESVANILVGVILAFTSQLIIFKLYNISVSHSVNAMMTVWFTAISLTRSFVLRRIFNRITLWLNTNKSTMETGSQSLCAVAGKCAATADSSTSLITESRMASLSRKLREINHGRMRLDEG